MTLLATTTVRVLAPGSRFEAPPPGRRASSRPWRAGLDGFAFRFWLGSLLLGSALAAAPAQAASFIVDNTTNDNDVDLLDPACDTHMSPMQNPCSLRAAIQQANATPGLDTITFAIVPAGAKLINLTATLTITDPVIINGTTQTGSVGGIELNFAALPGTDAGIIIENAGGGSEIRGLVINSCKGNGIRIFGSSNNTIAGNYIGTDRLGTTCNASLGNLVGIRIEGTASNPSNGNVIGGTPPGNRNIISASRNISDGIQMESRNGATSNNTIRGNYIGTDVNGAGTSCGNSRDGIQMFGAHPVANNVIAENVISGNASQGIWLSGAGTIGTVIRGNKIGTNAAGTGSSIPNVVAGVTLESGTNNNVVGGTTTQDRNLISGNANGIQLNNASSNLIQGNHIGTNVNGDAALPNTGQGIVVYGGGSNNTIGGTAAGAGNVISGNSSGRGIEIRDPGANGNIVQGNKIGTNAAGMGRVPNQIGVSIAFGPDNNIIGGTAANEGNLIAYNTTDGMHLVQTGDPTLNNSILGNAFHSNGSLGIDLNDDGVTSNDGGDGDSGPNDLLNFPLLTAAIHSAGTLTTHFKLDVPAGVGEWYRIEFFRDPFGAAPPVFAGSLDVNKTTAGSSSHTHMFPGSPGDVITATTTHCTNGPPCTTFASTSEFSAALNVATTEVTLLSFAAEGRDGAVDLSWTTASELWNLGFHLYRAEAAGGPYTRITTSLIPGLGSSPTGRSYAYRDSGLVNGRTYYYELEDVETTGQTERHGPVSAVTSAETSRGRGGHTYGDPSGVVLREIERDGGHVLLELSTPGFEAVPTEDGRVRVSIPGFASTSEAGEPRLPRRRAFVEAVSGRKVRLSSVTATDELTFPWTAPGGAGGAGDRGGRERGGSGFRGEAAGRTGLRRSIPVGVGKSPWNFVPGREQEGGDSLLSLEVGRGGARAVAASGGASRVCGEGIDGDVARGLARAPAGDPTGAVSDAGSWRSSW